MNADATRYWAEELGLPAEELFAEPFRVVPHGANLADYDGVFALFREGAAVVSLPVDRMGALRKRLPAEPFSPALFAGAFQDPRFRVIGPAYIGYAESVRAPFVNVRPLDAGDVSAAAVLQAACGETEWEHGGSEVGEVPCSGAFVGDGLVALAGYEIWGGSIAHISVVTHPAFRGQGHGRDVVAHLAGAAAAEGLILQYRTLDANTASIRIAESLGFARYATSVAVRLGGFA